MKEVYTMSNNEIAQTTKNVIEHKFHKQTKTPNKLVIMCEVEIMETLTENAEYRKQVKRAILKKSQLREHDHDMLRLIEVASM